jgi:hypothetical protein
MKTLIRATGKPQRSFLPITPFECESFEVRVRRVTRHIPLPTEVSFRKVNVHRLSRQLKTMPRPIDAVHRTKISLPSPSLQGQGLMCLHLGARPVDQPAALSSRQFPPTASNFFTTEAREPEQIDPSSHK